MICPRCQHENPPTARFCAQCGTALGANAADDEAYERRTVSILFADVRGFTLLSEARDPEEVTEIMNAAFAVLIAPVHSYGGTVARLMGDGMLALFGAPTAHEDDPERAVRAGLEMQAAIRGYATRLEQERGITGFAVRVGINTGEVVVGEVGALQDTEYTAMGDAINVAARLEQTAEPGAVLIGAATYRLVAHIVEAEALGDIAVHGRAAPVEVYRVQALRPEVSGKARGLPGDATPLVGRRAELDALLGSLERLHAGIGGIVTILGDAGIGKTRLVAEARAREPRESGVRWLTGRCQSFGATSAYHLWAIPLRQLLDIPPEAPPEDARARLGRGIAALESGATALPPATVAALTQVLALGAHEPLVGPPEPGPAADQVRHETFDAVAALLEAAARNGPIALVCEDLHWADPTSLDLLQHLLALSDRAPILFIILFRADPGHGSWQIREAAARDFPHRHIDIWLRPLSAAESETLALNFLGQLAPPPGATEDGPRRLVWRILSHSEGNPFYVEEVIRSLIDGGAIVPVADGWQITRDVQDIAIPDTLKGVLAARIDRLPRASRRVLQLAAVIGRTFQRRVLVAIAGDGPELNAHLLALQREEMIRERARLPEPEYSFKHHLTQEAAYDGLLKRERAATHRHVAETLERFYADQIEAHVEELAFHWERAGRMEKACDYLVQAGARARRVGASQEAIEFYHAALDRASKQRSAAPCLPPHRIHELLGDVHLENLGRNAEALAHYTDFLAGALGAAEAARAARKVAGLYLTRGDLTEAERHYGIALEHLSGTVASVEATRVHFGLSYLYMSRNQMAEASSHAETALKLAEAIGDTRGMADAYKMLGSLTDDLDASVDFLERSLALYRELGDLPRIAIACNNLADSLRLQGRLERALVEMEDGLKVARQIGNTRDEALLLITTGEVLIDQGRPEKAIPLLQQGLELGRASGVTARIIPAQHILGVAHREAGELDAARRHLQAAAAVSHETGHARYLPWIYLDLAQVELTAGDLDAASTQIGLAEAAAGPVPSGLAAALIARRRASVHLGRGDWGEAVSRLEESLRLLEGGGHGIESARGRLALGLAYAARNGTGDRKSACQQFRDAVATFRALEAPGYVTQAEIELGRLECTP
jgi:class 3 adenylate cyclase/tetratricopeptide (TPR) repeat protein